MKINRIVLILFATLFVSCNKFLDAKPDAALTTPTKIKDLQAMLDSHRSLNTLNGACGAPEISATDFYLTDQHFNARREEERRMYLWMNSNIFRDYGTNEWNENYKAIYISNSILGYADKMSYSDKEEKILKNIQGQSYFYRAQKYLNNLMIWAAAYDDEDSKTDLGVPIRLDTDFNKPSVRATVKEGYNQVIQDLKSAIPLLDEVQVHVMRPSKAAAYGLLARTYLFMNMFSEALAYADSALQLKPDLLDYNELNYSQPYPIPSFNKEVLHHSHHLAVLLSNVHAKLDSNLVKSYEINDRRRDAFLKDNNDGTYGFKGSYNGSLDLFIGIATDEMYLIRAECYARTGDLNSALADLNYLLKHRYLRGEFKAYSSDKKDEVINWILNERRKELVMRSLRFADVKRLNRLGYEISLTRTIEGKDYTLLPNDKRFVLPIPDDIIEKSGMPQTEY